MKIMIILAILLMAGSVTFAVGNITSCQDIIAPGEYVLAADLEYPAVSGPSTYGQCLNVSASDVTLDCQGHTITGTGDDGWANIRAIYLSPGSNITVRGCNLIDFEGEGIFADGITGLVVENITVSKEESTYSGYGIFTRYSDDVLIEDITIDRIYSGIHATTGNDIEINDITITGTEANESDPDGYSTLGSIGIACSFCNDTTITNVDAEGIDSYTVYLYVSDDVYLENIHYEPGEFPVDATYGITMSNSNATGDDLTLLGPHYPINVINTGVSAFDFSNVVIDTATLSVSDGFYGIDDSVLRVIPDEVPELPEGYRSFNDMAVELFAGSGTVDSITMYWSAEQEPLGDILQLWHYYGGTWTMLNDSSSGLQLSASDVTRGTVAILSYDEDDDGVPNDQDLCPGTVPDEIPDLIPGSYYLGPGGVIYDENGPTEYTALDTHGCSVEQVLYCKPGNNHGESNHGMTPGTLNVWMSQTGWASDCQVDGVVTVAGEGSTLPDVDADQDGKPDWWCEEHPNKC